MIAGAWILFRTSSARWTVPVLATVCTLLVAPGVQGAHTSMQSSSEASFAVLVWTPATVLIAYLGMRAAALDRSADSFAVDRPGRRRRVWSALLAVLAWPVLGWLGIWAGASVVTARNATPLHLVMILNGVALTLIATALGSAAAAVRAPAWVAAALAASAYCGLAVWLYVPYLPISILYSQYGPAFLSEDLPSPGYLLTQTIWAAVVLACAGSWLVGRRPSRLTVVTLGMPATLIALIPTGLDYTLPRAGHLKLACEAHRAVSICLWSDHEGARSLLEREVDLATSLVPGTRLPAVVVEGSWDELAPEKLLPTVATPATTVQVKVTRHPQPRAAAAELVARTLLPPSSCPELVSTPATGAVPVPSLVTAVVVAGRLDGTDTASDDRGVTDWLARTRADVQRCRPPGLP